MSEEKKVDITGLMVEATPGWEARVKELCKPKYFQVGIHINPELDNQISPEEFARLRKKLDLVQQAAEYMAAGMLKGTLKYPTDDIPLERWVAHVVGEGADQMNYQILLADAFFKQGQVNPSANPKDKAWRTYRPNSEGEPF